MISYPNSDLTVRNFITHQIKSIQNRMRTSIAFGPYDYHFSRVSPDLQIFDFAWELHEEEEEERIVDLNLYLY